MQLIVTAASYPVLILCFLDLTCPKNASIAVLFLVEPMPSSSPLMNAWLSLRGLGRSDPAIM